MAEPNVFPAEVGSEQYPRTAITDGQNFWTGKEWSPDPKKAQLFCNHQSTGEAIRNIYEQIHAGSPRRAIVIPVYFDLIGASTLPLADYLDWLEASTVFEVAWRRCGRGPIPGSYSVGLLDASEAKEIFPRPRS